MQTSESAEIHILENTEDAAASCSAFILKVLSSSLSSSGRATIAVSGGSSPKLLFADMAKADFDWAHVHVFWVDERCVPPDRSESNFKLANDNWLAPASVPPQNLHRVYGELDPLQGAQKYVADIKAFFELKEGEMPVFDVLHRGMGPDAHTASLFPGEPLINDTSGIAANVWVEKFQMHRVTLLPGVLRAAKQTVLQVSGLEKAEALKEVLQGSEDLMKYPCQIASRQPNAAWFLDKAAASKL
jgi:6-phosphogluconolactonase